MKNILRLQLRLLTIIKEKVHRGYHLYSFQGNQNLCETGNQKNTETKQHKGISSVTERKMLQLFRTNSFLFTFELTKILLVLRVQRTFIFISKATIHTFNSIIAQNKWTRCYLRCSYSFSKVYASLWADFTSECWL